MGSKEIMILLVIDRVCLEDKESWELLNYILVESSITNCLASVQVRARPECSSFLSKPLRRVEVLGRILAALFLVFEMKKSFL